MPRPYSAYSAYCNMQNMHNMTKYDIFIFCIFCIFNIFSCIFSCICYIFSDIFCIFSFILVHILLHILHILFHILHIYRHILHMKGISCIYMPNISSLSISLVSIGFNENSVKLGNCKPSAPELGHELACIIERRLTGSRALLAQRGLLNMAQPPQHQLPCQPHALQSKLSIP